MWQQLYPAPRALSRKLSGASRCRRRTLRGRPGLRPMPAPGRRMCWRNASFGSCSMASIHPESSALPSPRQPPPIWPTGCSMSCVAGPPLMMQAWIKQFSEFRISHRMSCCEPGQGGCSPSRWTPPVGSRSRPSTPSARDCSINSPSKAMSRPASTCSIRQHKPSFLPR